MKKVVDYFLRFADCQELYVTSDGQLFRKVNHAMNQAKHLAKGGLVQVLTSADVAKLMLAGKRPDVTDGVIAKVVRADVTDALAEAAPVVDGPSAQMPDAPKDRIPADDEQPDTTAEAVDVEQAMKAMDVPAKKGGKKKG